MDRKALTRRLMQVFRTEFGDHVTSLENDLLALERQPGIFHADTVVSLFRTAHTLKGAARTVDIGILEAAADHLESIFQQARETGRAFTPEHFRMLFATVDALKDTASQLALDDAPAGGADSTLGRLLPALRLFSLGKQAQDAAPQSSDLLLPLPAAPEPGMPATGAGSSDSVRISSLRLDRMMALGGELLLARRRLEVRQEQLETLLESISGPPGSGMSGSDSTELTLRELAGTLAGYSKNLRQDRRQLDQVAEPLEHEIRHARMVPFFDACEGLRRVVRDLARELHKEAELDIVGGEIEVDRSIVQGIRDPLLHLLRNALAHGIETPAVRVAQGKPASGRITLAAALGGGRVELTLSDDGQGLDLAAIRERSAASEAGKPVSDAELMQCIFKPGFSTAKTVSPISGRGVGLDVVMTAVTRLRGHLDMRSVPGRGVAFMLNLPLTLSQLPALLVTCADQLYAFDTSTIRSLLRVPAGELESLEGHDVLQVEGAPVRVFLLSALLGLASEATATVQPLSLLLLESGGRRAAFIVDALLAQQTVAVKGLGSRLAGLPLVTGATIQPDGQVALILDTDGLLMKALQHSAGLPLRQMLTQADEQAKPKLLVVDDSPTTRTLMKGILEAEGFAVTAAEDGLQAWHQIQRGNLELVVSDVEMPHMNGFDLTETIRASARFKDLPVILVTALANDKDRLRGMEAGANAYIVKSAFDQSELMQVIRQIL